MAAGSQNTASAGGPVRRLELVLALAIFFASGFAALLYQVTWQRMLVIFSGADIYSITIIVAAFMAGLGMGSLAGGQIADRVGLRSSLWLFAGAELAIGLFGLLSKSFYYDLLYTRLSFLAASPAVGLILFLSLLWPTFFMGASLPLLARGLTRSLAATGSVVGSLYGWNTLGAAVGALAATWMLLPSMGPGALWVGAGINVTCALGAALLAWRVVPLAPEPLQDVKADNAQSRDDALSLPFRAWAVLFGLSGFVALSFEIVWFRVLGVLLKSPTFTFGTLLALYLMGLGVGATLGARRVARSANPGLTFLALQVAVVVTAGLSLIALLQLVSSGRPESVAAFLAAGEPYDVYPGLAYVRDVLAGQTSESTSADLRSLLMMHVVLPLLLIGVPVVLMGLSFPYLQKAAHANYARVGRRIGILMAANIAGSTIGASATGLLLLSWLGAAATLKLLVAIGLIPGALLLRAAYGRRRAALPAMLVAALLVTVVLMPDGATLWATLHGTEARRVLIAEDGSGLSVIMASPEGFSRQSVVYVNGASQGRIPFGDIHTILGALPLLIHPSPADVLIIGLGSGDTCFSAAGRPEVQRLACVEIIGKQRTSLEALIRLGAGAEAGPAALFADRRVEHVVADGRAYLMRSDRRYDIIEADALRPISAYSGNLYSVEYFTLLKRYLKPNGLAVTWAPTDRVRATFRHVFPHVLTLDGDQIYIGSNEPIRFDPDEILRRAASAPVRDYFSRGGVSIVPLIDERLARPTTTYGPHDERPGPDNLNSDLWPRDEYTLPEILPF